MTHSLIAAISNERFRTYLISANYNQKRALALYAWNMKISASFYPLLALIEICLRNQIEPKLQSVFSSNWWKDHNLHSLLGSKGKGILLRAEGKIRDQRNNITSGRITAELSFGFWVNMLLDKYHADLWQNIHADFPHLPKNETRQNFHNLAKIILALRNRISHHEPIFNRDLTKEYSNCIKMIQWLSPDTEKWLKPQLEIMSLMRTKP
jgi:hypothetical protein